MSISECNWCARERVRDEWVKIRSYEIACMECL